MPRFVRQGGSSALLILLLAFTLSILVAGPAAAYQLSIDAPRTISVGLPLVVNGTTTLPAGISVDVVFSRQETYPSEVARQTVTIQSTKDFQVVFDTARSPWWDVQGRGPPHRWFPVTSGTPSRYAWSSLLNRSTEIEMRSPRNQEYNGVLRLSGVLAKTKGTGVQVQVSRGNETVFGPSFIATSKEGVFTKDIPIDSPGTYIVSFTDSTGFIGTVNFTVTRPPPTVSETSPTTRPTLRADTVTASAPASRDSPAYFLVAPKSGTVTLTTSAGTDWVVEYAIGNGPVEKVNNAGAESGETVTLSPSDTTVAVMVYPYRYSDSGNVTLSAENAEKVEVQARPIPVFAGSVAGATSTKSPIQGAVVLLAIGIAGLLLTRRR